jgi:hypothetical protein
MLLLWKDLGVQHSSLPPPWSFNSTDCLRCQHSHPAMQQPKIFDQKTMPSRSGHLASEERKKNIFHDTQIFHTQIPYPAMYQQRSLFFHLDRRWACRTSYILMRFCCDDVHVPSGLPSFCKFSPTLFYSGPKQATNTKQPNHGFLTAPTISTARQYHHPLQYQYNQQYGPSR